MDLPVLTIAGSDPSGGAGIQADLKTMTALQCYGMSVITALTAQNTKGVQAVHACPSEFVGQQLSAVLEDISPKAIKTGMLSDKATVKIVSRILKDHLSVQTSAPRALQLVVDPVMVSTSGHHLLQSSAIRSLKEELLPLATIITPNIPEAQILLSDDPAVDFGTSKIDSIEKMKSAARRISQSIQGSDSAVLLKGGHFELSLAQIVHGVFGSDTEVDWRSAGLCDPAYPTILRAAQSQPEVNHVVVDVLYHSTSSVTAVDDRCLPYVAFIRPRIDTTSTHGTGCTLSAALACEIAKGHSVKDATRLAIAYTYQGIATATNLGYGHGPLNHLHSIKTQVLSPATPISPFPCVSSFISSSKTSWNAYVGHDFVTKLGEGTLNQESFVHFLKQDYIYLKYYSRAYGILAAKSTTFAELSSSAAVIAHISRESRMHVLYCASFGVTEAELDLTTEATITTAYGAFLLEIGMRGDRMALEVALLACLIGYGEVGLQLLAQSKAGAVRQNKNPYQRWIEDYSGEEYQTACRHGIDTLERHMANDPPSQTRYDELSAIWRRCVQLEKAFWDMSMTLST